MTTVPVPPTAPPATPLDLLAQVADQTPPGSAWPAYAAAARELDRLAPSPLPAGRRVRVALLGSFTLDPFVPFLRVEAARSGLWPDLYVAPYGQFLQELLDGGSALYRFRPQVTFVAIHTDVLWDMRWAREVPRESRSVVDALVEPLFAGLTRFASEGSGIVVVNDFPLLRSSTEGVNAFRSKDTFAHTVAHANKRLRIELARHSSTFLFPLADVVAHLGRARAFNWRTHYRGHVPWSDGLMGEVGRRYAGFASAAAGRATKCIVLDLDNTLWGGIVGEVGPDGVALGPQHPGIEFLDFQRELLDLQRQGILLAVASKNDEADALAVLRDHPHMLVREHHLAAWRIGWTDKATSIRELAAELNLGLDHLLFIDDSPEERAWVRHALPEVLVPEVPANPCLYAEWIGSLPSLIVLRQTAEDALRTTTYHQQRQRDALRATSASLESFLESLDLHVTVAEATEAELPRVTQLLAKTNQFNLTTRRHGEADLRRRRARDGWRVLVMRVADRFGDFGLTGVAIAEPRGDAWHLDSFLMSCRVIGKTVETAFLAAVADAARAAGVRWLTAELIPSGRNDVVRPLLPSHGFEEDDGRWRLDLTRAAPIWPPYIVRAAAQPAPADREAQAPS